MKRSVKRSVRRLATPFTFTRLGLVLTALLQSCGTPTEDDEGAPVAAPGGKADSLACKLYRSSEQEYAPVQRVGARAGGKILPPGYAEVEWGRPATTAPPTYFAPFSGSPGARAGHEGVDYVVPGSGPSQVPIRAAADGLVVYLRVGCPQSCMFCHNTSLRECGSGWGNHVVVKHERNIYTRYAHLKPGSIPAGVQAGTYVTRGQQIALMGNSGRSELRHLHFELGTLPGGFDSCKPAQSLHRVYDPDDLPFGNTVQRPEHYGKIACPAPFKLEEINAAGGKLCVSGQGKYEEGAEAFGPFTAKMIAKCQAWGGGPGCKAKQIWSRAMAESAYGSAGCPEGAVRDAGTGYCVEGDDGFGPFPQVMVEICQGDPGLPENQGKGCLGGGPACKTARWHVSVVRAAYRKAHPDG